MPLERAPSGSLQDHTAIAAPMTPGRAVAIHTGLRVGVSASGRTSHFLARDRFDLPGESRIVDWRVGGFCRRGR